MNIKYDQRTGQRLMYEAAIWHDNILPGRFYMAKIVNISQKGLYFESDQILYPGEKIYIDTKGPEPKGNNSNNRTEIEINWSKTLNNSSFSYGYGAKFIELNNPLVKSIGKSKTVNRNSQSSGGEYKRDPRQHARQRYGKEIVFTVKNRQHHGVLSNISRGGAFITTEYKFALGQLILIDIREDITHKAHRLKGWVVRSSPNGVGIKFNRRAFSSRRIENRRNRTRRPFRNKI